jgi:hypothetical protein
MARGVDRRTRRATRAGPRGIYVHAPFGFFHRGMIMKQFAVLILLILGLALFGCGSSSNRSNINGNWNATLIGTNSNTPIFSFGTSITQTSNGNLSISNFQFTTNSPCFASESENGSFTLSGNFNGNVTGKFGMTILSTSPTGNTLALTGQVNGSVITGNWTLTGSSGCSGNGTFTMNRM